MMGTNFYYILFSPTIGDWSWISAPVCQFLLVPVSASDPTAATQSVEEGRCKNAITRNSLGVLQTLKDLSLLCIYHLVVGKRQQPIVQMMHPQTAPDLKAAEKQHQK